MTNHATVATGGDASPPRPKAERSGERREASKIPDLKKQGIKQPHVALTQTEFYTWHLFTNEKLKASEIAAHRQISENTIYEHLWHSIELGVLKWDMVIPPEIRKRVLDAEKTVGKAPDGFLKRIHLALNSEVSYGQIRCGWFKKSTPKWTWPLSPTPPGASRLSLRSSRGIDLTPSRSDTATGHIPSAFVERQHCLLVAHLTRVPTKSNCQFARSFDHELLC